MDLKQIEKLLDKYFESATSIAEEKQLKSYFSSEGVAQHLEQYRPLFGYFAKEDSVKYEKEIAVKTRKRSNKWLYVAAGFVLLFSMFTFLNQQTSQEELGTYNDPEIAFKETQKALNMLSKNVNVGVNSVNYLEEYEKSKKTIFKH